MDGEAFSHFNGIGATNPFRVGFHLAVSSQSYLIQFYREIQAAGRPNWGTTSDPVRPTRPGESQKSQVS